MVLLDYSLARLYGKDAESSRSCTRPRGDNGRSPHYVLNRLSPRYTPPLKLPPSRAVHSRATKIIQPLAPILSIGVTEPVRFAEKHQDSILYRPQVGIRKPQLLQHTAAVALEHSTLVHALISTGPKLLSIPSINLPIRESENSNVSFKKTPLTGNILESNLQLLNLLYEDLLAVDGLSLKWIKRRKSERVWPVGIVAAMDIVQVLNITLQLRASSPRPGIINTGGGLNIDAGLQVDVVPDISHVGTFGLILNAGVALNVGVDHGVMLNAGVALYVGVDHGVVLEAEVALIVSVHQGYGLVLILHVTMYVDRNVEVADVNVARLSNHQRQTGKNVGIARPPRPTAGTNRPPNPGKNLHSKTGRYLKNEDINKTL